MRLSIKFLSIGLLIIEINYNFTLIQSTFFLSPVSNYYVIFNYKVNCFNHIFDFFSLADKKGDPSYILEETQTVFQYFFHTTLKKPHLFQPEQTTSFFADVHFHIF